VGGVGSAQARLKLSKIASQLCSPKSHEKKIRPSRHPLDVSDPGKLIRVNLHTELANPGPGHGARIQSIFSISEKHIVSKVLTNIPRSLLQVTRPPKPIAISRMQPQQPRLSRKDLRQ
jgi:hypothetical protein